MGRRALNDGCSACGAAASPEDERGPAPCNVREFSKETFTYIRCSACRSLRCAQTVDLDRYYANYPFKRHRLDLWTRVAYGNMLRRLRRAGLSSDDAILDYGCGPGLWIEFLKRRGYRNAVGYDAFEPRFSDLAALGRRYDLVFSQDVLEHVESPKSFLDETARLAAPGGLIYLGTPNAAEIELSHPEEYSIDLHPPYHRHILSEHALLGLTRELGLSVVARYDRYYYDTLFPGVNYRFLKAYVAADGDCIDVLFGPPRFDLVARSPRLLLLAALGFFCPPRSMLTLILRKGE